MPPPSATSQEERKRATGEVHTQRNDTGSRTRLRVIHSGVISYAEEPQEDGTSSEGPDDEDFASLGAEEHVKTEAMGVIRKKTATRGGEGGVKYVCDVCSADITSTVSSECPLSLMNASVC